jgi:glutamate-5-semialdehyde dehydrogenase
MMHLFEEMQILGKNAQIAARQIVSLNAEQKKEILFSMAAEIGDRRDLIKDANKKDIEAGEKSGLSPAMLDRLKLTDQRIDAMMQGIRDVANLNDVIGQVISETERPNGLKIRKVRVPIGVIGIIYESRPNVTADAAALCLKSSNVVILRGGSEAINSNLAISQALQMGGKSRGLPENAVQFIQTPEREAVRELVQMEGLVDLIIPRGGEGLIRTIAEMARVPVLKHYKGVCHTYVDAAADPEMALAVSINAKCQRPGVCNAMETLLVHQDIAETFLPVIAHRLLEQGVEIRGDTRTRDLIPEARKASEEDWSTEYLDMILSVKVVSGVGDAVAHINKYGSHHSDAIISGSEKNQQFFTQNVDSATVYVNASTRFTDGGEFGMGAEMGISTDKLHARGPVGIEELTTYKYIIIGQGQVRT